jgi:hypothetical protein
MSKWLWNCATKATLRTSKRNLYFWVDIHLFKIIVCHFVSFSQYQFRERPNEPNYFLIYMRSKIISTTDFTDVAALKYIGSCGCGMFAIRLRNIEGISIWHYGAMLIVSVEQSVNLVLGRNARSSGLHTTRCLP